eukprot:TRINITY_DN14650_c0_g1_i1.p1 TRINITY_DN14650_c0_g1~~TRINITY_DN14650_c0_g1_i1.p1  ORF type:complete len:149 (-),score=46.56 TRINITY_DN14650_c0_g1_i1:54-455(-)
MGSQCLSKEGSSGQRSQVHRMRTSVAVLATIAAFAIPSTAAFKPFIDIVQVISNEDLSEAQLSDKLKAEKSVKDAVLDDPISLSCTVGDHAEIELCSWRREDGPHLYVQGSDVIDTTEKQIEASLYNTNNPRS